MNIELLLVIEKHTDTLIEQTKTKLPETLDFKLNKQMGTFSSSPPNNFVEEDKWLLAVTSFECKNENNSFPIIIPCQWRIHAYLDDDIINNLNNLLNPKPENNI